MESRTSNPPTNAAAAERSESTMHVLDHRIWDARSINGFVAYGIFIAPSTGSRECINLSLPSIFSYSSHQIFKMSAFKDQVSSYHVIHSSVLALTIM